MGSARIAALSKCDSNYPTMDQVRMISVLPHISKLVELIILQELNPILYGDGGFIPVCQ